MGSLGQFNASNSGPFKNSWWNTLPKNYNWLKIIILDKI
jgi:hypothetical protein